MINNNLKYKERHPDDTLEYIIAKLKEVGIEVVEDSIDSGISKCHSMRLMIEGTLIGTNGKGTSRDYSRASGYAEFMERLQNNLLYTGSISPNFAKEMGFWLAPDEIRITNEQMSTMDNSCIDRYIEAVSKMPDGTKLSRKDAVAKWSFGIKNKPEFDFIALPFFSCKTRKIYYMPYSILRSVFGSNGMCAGNTAEEALVQGLSEIFERFVNVKIITDKITPPEIPEEYLMRYPETYALIEEIRQKGNFRVSVRDCSFGKGYPVVCTVVYNTSMQSYYIKFGAHPSFEIALERTLTELLQGKNLTTLKAELVFNWGDKSAEVRDNLINIIKTGSGAYPEEFHSGEPSYKFTPFKDVTGKSNSELLKDMLEILVSHGYDVLIRDVSFMGFPTFFIVVPGFSEVYYFDDLRVRERNTLDNVNNIARNIHIADNSELEKLLRYIKFKKNAIFENNLRFLYGLPLNNNFCEVLYPEKYFEAIINIRLGNNLDALKCILEALAILQKKYDIEHKGLIFLRCFRDCLWSIVDNTDKARAIKLLSVFYEEHLLNYIMEILSDPQTIIQKAIPKVSCWNCDECESIKSCEYTKVTKFLIKVGSKAKENIINQMDLGSFLPQI